MESEDAFLERAGQITRAEVERYQKPWNMSESTGTHPLLQIPSFCHAWARAVMSSFYISNLAQECAEVRPSTIHGRGLFATRAIAAGTIVTYYPAHMVVVDMKTGNSRNNAMHKLFSGIDGDERAVTAGETMDSYIQYYSIDVESRFSFVGFPCMTQHPLLLGHMANDGVGGAAELTPEEYCLRAARDNNARFCYMDHMAVALVATRDIAADNEICVAYGHGYWKTFAQMSPSKSSC